MANRMYQSVIHQMKGVIDRICGVLDQDGNIVACSDLSLIGNDMSQALSSMISKDEAFACEGYTYKAFGTVDVTDCFVFVEGTDEQSIRYSGLLAISLCEIRRYFDEKFDKVSFLKNLIFDNVLPGELYAKSKELMFSADCDRAVFLIRTSTDSDASAVDILQNIFPERSKDFVIGINETDAVLIKELKNKTDGEELEKMGNLILAAFQSEYYSKCYVGIGAVTHNIKDLAKAYKESQIALEVGKVFENDKHIINYDNLGIGRLIYQLPTTLCEMFINEVFKDGSINLLDSETLLTIQKFFENNLNVSETARKLFVHRNTLVYRLEKIKKLTGLDIREFDNAITFKVAIMVNRYLTNNTGKF